MNTLGRKPTVDALLAALSDPEADVRGRAAQSLGHASDERKTQALLSLLNDPEPDVRSLAIIALGEGSDKQAIPGLLEALAKDTDRNVCRHIANVLRSACSRFGLGSEEKDNLARDLIDVLLSAQAGSYRQNKGVSALIHTESQHAWNWLFEQINDTKCAFKETIIDNIDFFVEMGNVGENEEIDRYILDGLSAVLQKNPDAQMRLWSVSILRGIRTEKSRDVLTHALRAEKNNSVYLEMLEALNRITLDLL